ncbi:crossover junction endodeoxyribonuclease RuvC [bacterium]|nr:crossover junction endodeoxyribonuclease RuvC [bacterium]
MKPNELVILGIDPGLEKTGYGLVSCCSGKEKLIEGGVIRTKIKSLLEERLAVLYKGMDELINDYGPSVIAIEDVYVHKKYPKTALIIGYVRGVYLMLAGLHNIPVAHYSATRIKKFLTGNGRASKEQIQRTIMSRLKIAKTPHPNDVSDALAAALCHASFITKM